jgi:hypothetical protein
VEIVGRKTARKPEIHGGHDRIVETIRIDVDPETVKLGAREVADGIFRGRLDADALNRGQIECTQLRGQRLAAVVGLVFRVA